SAICAPGELFQLSIEALRLLQEWRVANAVVPRRFRDLAVVQYAFGHGGKHHGIRAALSYEHGNRDPLKGRRKIKFALSHGAAHARSYYHIESQDFFEITLQDWLDDARAQEPANCCNVGGKVIFTGGWCVL